MEKSYELYIYLVDEYCSVLYKTGESIVSGVNKKRDIINKDVW